MGQEVTENHGEIQGAQDPAPPLLTSSQTALTVQQHPPSALCTSAWNALLHPVLSKPLLIHQDALQQPLLQEACADHHSVPSLCTDKPGGCPSKLSLLTQG